MPNMMETAFNELDRIMKDPKFKESVEKELERKKELCNEVLGIANQVETTVSSEHFETVFNMLMRIRFPNLFNGS